jgi:hypothetical protein
MNGAGRAGCPQPAAWRPRSRGLVINHIFRGAWPRVGPVPPPGVFCFQGEHDDLALASFDRVCALGRMFQIFGYQVDPLLTGLNELLAGCPPGFRTTSLRL